MKRMILLILLVALAFTLGCAQAETEKLVVSPTFTMYMYTDIHQTEAGYTFVDASVGQYIQDSKHGNMLVVSASISVDYDRIESNPVLFWNLYINGEKLAEVPIFSEPPNAGSHRKDVNYYADVPFEGMIEHAMLVPVGNDQRELKNEAVILLGGLSDPDQVSADEKEQIPVTVAYDTTQWDQYWKPGEKKLETTEETRSKVDAILLRIDQASVGTPVREGADSDTVEFQYAEYQRMFQNGMDVREQLFADTGKYIWAIGLPDDQSITQEEAKKLSCRILLEDAGISEEQMVHFYPHFTYETGNPENPFWHVTWMPFDQGADVSAILDVAVYAHDGSICGYRIAVPVG